MGCVVQDRAEVVHDLVEQGVPAIPDGLSFSEVRWPGPWHILTATVHHGHVPAIIRAVLPRGQWILRPLRDPSLEAAPTKEPVCVYRVVLERVRVSEREPFPVARESAFDLSRGGVEPIPARATRAPVLQGLAEPNPCDVHIPPTT